MGRGTTTTTKKKRKKVRKGPKPWWEGRVKAKVGVKIGDLKPEALEALKIVYLLYRCHNRTLTVTSTNDGKHMKGSKHYSGNAFDCRIWDFLPNSLLTLIKDVKALLGDEFDVLHEDSHIHVEFDPLRSKLTR